MDIKKIKKQLKEIKKERKKLEEKIKLLNEEKTKLKDYNSYENEDEFIKDTVRKTSKNKIKKIDEKLLKIDKRLDEIFEKEISLTKEKSLLKLQANNIVKNIYNVNSEIIIYNLKIRQFEELLDKAKSVGTNEEIISLINKQYEDLINERDEKKKILEQFKYEGSIIFDSSKKKADAPEELKEDTNSDVEIQTIEENLVPIVDLKEHIAEPTKETVEIQPTEEISNQKVDLKENIEEPINEEISEKENTEEQTQEVSMIPIYPEEHRLTVVPTEEIKEEVDTEIDAEHILDDVKKEEETKENRQENTPPKKHSVGEIMKAGYEAAKEKLIDVKEEIAEKMKKRVKLIKHIPDWIKKAGKDVMVAGIVAITYLLVSPYLAPTIAAVSTFGKHK